MMPKYDGLTVGSVTVAVTDDDTPQPQDTPQTGDGVDANNGDASGEPEEQKGKNPALELTGTNGPDDLEGGDGNDLLIGKKGNDVLRGGKGKDELRGGKGDDDLYGGRGADTLFGGQGDDELAGGRGADRLLGGDGDDTYTGGPGADRFVFVAGETGEKIITDFGDGDDMIVLRGVGLAGAGRHCRQRGGTGRRLYGLHPGGRLDGGDGHAAVGGGFRGEIRFSPYPTGGRTFTVTTLGGEFAEGHALGCRGCAPPPRTHPCSFFR